MNDSNKRRINYEINYEILNELNLQYPRLSNIHEIQIDITHTEFGELNIDVNVPEYFEEEAKLLYPEAFL